jgi:hypothetical protein
VPHIVDAIAAYLYSRLHPARIGGLNKSIFESSSMYKEKVGSEPRQSAPSSDTA